MHDAVMTNHTAAKAPTLYGVVAEYDTEQKLLEASRQVRDAGYTRWDTHTPYPVHGLDEAMGNPQPVLPFVVFGAGLTGTLVALGLQTFTNAIDYQFVVSGKPLVSLPANIPIVFELTVLFSALTAFGGMLAFNGLPMLYHPLFNLPRFARATADRFFIAIEAADPKYDVKNTRKLLSATNPSALEDCYDPQDGKIPFAFYVPGVIAACFALIPPAIVYKMRNTRSPDPKIHLVLDMDFQNKYKAQSSSAFFADGKTSRPQVGGTVARGQLHDANEHLHTGKIDGKWATTFPFEVTEERMKRGQERFGIYCAACHGYSGKGDGMVARRADQLMADKKESDWVAPTNLNNESVAKQTHGELYNTATHGIRNMAGYASQISDEDRWNIILYVRALQRSNNAREKDVPPEELAKLTAQEFTITNGPGLHQRPEATPAAAPAK
ncbi:MAG TPA: quinol:electron acceptor oxidoreductase subunit ActD [Planctomycetota bacterium]|nr:quinol:electron acceptor oxidoreductase subunit ActD [Planctomycetota bacterium]